MSTKKALTSAPKASVEKSAGSKSSKADVATQRITSTPKKQAAMVWPFPVGPRP